MAAGSDAVVSCRLNYRHLIIGIESWAHHPRTNAHPRTRTVWMISVTCNVGYRVGLPNICVTWPTALMRLSSSKGLDR
jgi:hypothetical protein